MPPICLRFLSQGSSLKGPPFLKRPGVVSKRRSSVNISAIKSIILPQALRSKHDQQPNNWDCEEEEFGGKATCA